MSAVTEAVTGASALAAIERRLGRERARALFSILAATPAAGSGDWQEQEQLFAALAWAARENVPCSRRERIASAQLGHTIRMARIEAMARAYCAERHIDPAGTDRMTGASNLEEALPVGLGLLDHFDRFCATFTPGVNGNLVTAAFGGLSDGVKLVQER